MMHVKHLALFAAHAAAAAVTLPSEPIIGHGIVWERNICNADNCLRNLLDRRYSSSASAFCSTFIQSTVTFTNFAVATNYTTATVTPTPVVVTQLVVDNIRNATATTRVTQYSTISDSRYNKRSASAAPAYPSWLPKEYPEQRVSSACSCLIPSPSPVIQTSVTLTNSTQTVTETDVLPTATITVSQISTNVTNFVATQTSTVGIECGIKGCITGSHVLDSSRQPSKVACKAMCMLNPHCASFQWGTTDHICNLSFEDSDTVWYPYSKGGCLAYAVFDRNCQA